VTVTWTRSASEPTSWILTWEPDDDPVIRSGPDPGVTIVNATDIDSPSQFSGEVVFTPIVAGYVCQFSFQWTLVFSSSKYS
jgi:hypothetical protein